MTNKDNHVIAQDRLRISILTDALTYFAVSRMPVDVIPQLVLITIGRPLIETVDREGVMAELRFRAKLMASADLSSADPVRDDDRAALFIGVVEFMLTHETATLLDTTIVDEAIARSCVREDGESRSELITRIRVNTS